MSTYRPEEVPPERRRTKPGTVCARQRVDHTAESLAARDALAQAQACSPVEAVRRALSLVSPEAAHLAQVLAERWGCTPRTALERALAEVERSGSTYLHRAATL